MFFNYCNKKKRKDTSVSLLLAKYKNVTHKEHIYYIIFLTFLKQNLRNL